jgi:hypothetical protein
MLGNRLSCQTTGETTIVSFATTIRTGQAKIRERSVADTRDVRSTHRSRSGRKRSFVSKKIRKAYSL